MHKVNTNEIVEEFWASPKAKFASASKGISLALGRKRESTDLRERHPFDVEICRIPAGKSMGPFHAHSAQWEFYHVLSGRGTVRHGEGTLTVAEGDAFIFPPGEAHQLTAAAETDLVLYIVADNPIGESCFYSDSGKWLVRAPERRLIRSEPLDYFDGED